ncbi:MAG TPA: L,D-transpeptidase family protein [Thermoleophilaceae bacterium]|nr:L,D-transpeptidase family protein [Thermoleophilaceae bacterium]
MRLAALTFVAALCAAPALAAGERPKRLPDGSSVAGVDVGGLGPVGAKRALRAALTERYGVRITVRVGARDREFEPFSSGLVIGYAAMVEQAFDQAAAGEPVEVPVALDVNRSKVRHAASRVGARWYRAPRNARVRYGVTRVKRIRHRSGRRLDTARLERALAAELVSPTPGRVVKAGLRAIRPKVTTSRLGRIHHTFVSIDRGSTTLRLFKRLRVVRTYRVAVGAAGFETPRGIRRVLWKQVDPPWHAPNRPWAGAFAGKTIPSGDPRNPLKARFIALGDGIGVHGTSEEWSIGTRASHGCIRMRVRDVKRLYPKVPVGTPVLIR